jgi:hypothetical protein
MANVVQIVLRGVDQFSGSFSKATSSLAGFKTFAAGAALSIASSLGAAATAASVLTAKAIETADQTGQMAQKAGLAVEDFSRLAYASGLAGVSQEQLVTASKGLSQWLERTGQSSREILHALIEMADEFAGMEDGAEKVRRAFERFGKTGQDLIPLLNQGSAALREQFKEAERAGAVIGPAFTANANQFNSNLDRMKLRLEGVFLQFADHILPKLVEFTEWLIKASDSSGAVGKAAAALSSAFDVLNTALEVTARHGKTVLTVLSPMAGFLVSAYGKAIDEALAAKAAAMESEKALREMQKRLEEPPKGAGLAQSVEDLARYRQLIDEMIISTQRAHENQAVLWQEEDLRHEKRIAQIEALTATEDQHRNLKLRAEEEHAARLDAIHRQMADNAERLRQARLQGEARTATGMATIFGNLATVAAAFGRKGFAVFKALRIAEALASTYAGAARALAEWPWPYSIAVAASVVAAGIAQVATISALQPAGAAHGGLDYVPSESTFLLQRGERVIQPEANRDLTAFLERFRDGGGGSGAMRVVINLDGRALLDYVGEATRDGRLEIDARSVT